MIDYIAVQRSDLLNGRVSNYAVRSKYPFDFSDHCLLTLTLLMPRKMDLPLCSFNTHTSNLPAGYADATNLRSLQLQRLALPQVRHAAKTRLNKMVQSLPQPDPNSTPALAQHYYQKLTNTMKDALTDTVGEVDRSENIQVPHDHEGNSKCLIQRGIHSLQKQLEKLHRLVRKLGSKTTPQLRSKIKELDIKISSEQKRKANRDVSKLIGDLRDAETRNDPKAAAIAIDAIWHPVNTRTDISPLADPLQDGKLEAGSAEIARIHQQAIEIRGGKPKAAPGSLMASADAWVKTHKDSRGSLSLPPKIFAKFPRARCEAATVAANATISAKEVKVAFAAGAKGKSAGEDQISYDVLHLLNEGSLVTMANFFNICFDLGWIPTQWSTAILKMLFKLDAHKDAAKAYLTSNYRQISLLSCIGKTYERVLMSRVEQVVETDLPSIDDSQMGFRKGRDAKLHIFTIQEISEMLGNDLLMVFLDMAKAFESVYRSFLLMYLHEAGVVGKLWFAVASFYDKNLSRVWVTNVLSEEIEIAKGIREGAILSPTLWKIFMNVLLVELQDSYAGITFPDPSAGRGATLVHIPNCTLADDIQLMARSVADMQKLCDIAGNFAERHGGSYGYSKCGYMLVRPLRIRHSQVILHLKAMIGNDEPNAPADVIKRCKDDTYKYLGFWEHASGSWANHINRILAGVSKRLADMRKTLLNHDLLCPSKALDLLRFYAQPKLTATSFIWLSLEDLVPNPAPAKYPKTLQAKLDNMYAGTVRAIGGFDSHINLKSINKLLGWEGNCKVALLEKVRFYNRVMSLEGSRANKLLRHRMTIMGQTNIMDTTKFSDLPPRSSSFLWDVLQILRVTLGASTARNHALRPCMLPRVVIKRDFPHAVHEKVATHLNLQFMATRTASWTLHRPDVTRWVMAPYLAEVKSDNTTRDHLTIAHVQAGSHALASSLCKMYKGSPLCPACRCWVVDDINHQLWSCQAC